MSGSKPCQPRPDLAEMARAARARFDALPPSQKLRHLYMQRRSFVRGMGPSNVPYLTHCANVERRMPHESTLTDTEIGLILAGETLSIPPIPEPAKGADPDQNATGGVLIPSMAAEQSGEPEAGEMPAAGASAAAPPALLAPAEPAAVEVGCGQAPEFYIGPME